MKQNFIIFVALLLLAACTTKSNTLIEEGLNGKVKTVKSMCYEAEETSIGMYLFCVIMGTAFAS